MMSKETSKTAYVDMTEFSPEDFRGWYNSMNKELLLMIDRFARAWPGRVIISPAHGSLGRHGAASTSQHNVDKWGEVRAVDIMLPGSVDIDLERAVQLARQIGFTGIGAYPHWKPYVGMHLDIRQDRMAHYPALWAGIKKAGTQVYRAVEQAWS